MNPRQVAEIVAARIAASATSRPSRSPDRASSTSGCPPARSCACCARRASAGWTSAASTWAAGKRVQVEFVSANPVGPMHVGHGRWAALGDSMARMLDARGLERGARVLHQRRRRTDGHLRQVGRRSLPRAAPATRSPSRTTGTKAPTSRDRRGDPGRRRHPPGPTRPPRSARSTSQETAYAAVLEHLSRCCTGWASTSTCGSRSARCTNRGPTAPPPSRKRSRRCATAGYIYDLDGAVWFRSTEFGDDKDRVLIKADGEYTYFAADIAYHKNKYDRGFDRVINIWGADHHGYVRA